MAPVFLHTGVLALAVQAWRHENAKTWQVLVSLTACMVASILARQDELNMKHPVVVSAVRAWFFLGERYRLPVLLRLHAICLVTRNEMWCCVCACAHKPLKSCRLMRLSLCTSTGLSSAWP